MELIPDNWDKAIETSSVVSVLWVSNSPLTYRDCDEFIGEVSVWGGKGEEIQSPLHIVCGTILLHSLPHASHTFAASAFAKK